MDTIVLKFGGSSVADNEKLQIVVNKIKEFYNITNKIVVVVSAQGKTTDQLLKQANDLSKIPNERELDVLLSAGEQISMSKLSILLNENDIPAISLTGWQAGIITNNINQNAVIEEINISRIKSELDKGNVVIIAGFQGINENCDISTLGRGGSDTTAVAIAASLNAKNCYIFSDVDGVYTADPKQILNAKKLSTISYNEMLDISNEGAKVLHNRCVEIGKKYGINIIAKSTFNDKNGTVVKDKIEDVGIKSIIKRDISRISIIGSCFTKNKDIIKKIIDVFDELYLEILSFELTETKICINLKKSISDDILEELHEKLILI